MGLKEQLARYPSVGGGIGAVLLIAAVAMAVRSLTAGEPANHKENTYYSDDDGSSYFAGQATDCEDLARRAKPAYVASVYSCDGAGGHPYVAYLSRQTPDALADVAKAEAKVKELRSKYEFNDNRVSEAQIAVAAARRRAEATAEVKRPGTANHWVRSASPEGIELTNVKCPDGKGVPQQLLP